MRRSTRLRTVATAALAAFLLAACGGSGSDSSSSGGAPDTVRIAFQTIPNSEPIVKQKGWLEESLGSATKVEWKPFDSGADVNTAVAAGEVDLGLVGSSPATTGIAKGLGYKVVWIFDVLGENEALVVQKKSGISSVADLKGKKIGTPFGSTSHYSLLAALQQAKVDPASVDILDMQPQNALAAWQNGSIDGAYLWVPTLAAMEKSGGKVIVTSADMAKAGALTADIGIASTSFADSHPDVVKKWLAAENRGVQLWRSKPTEAAAAVAQEFSLTPADAQAQMKQLGWLDAAQQASPEYLGNGTKDGAFVTVLKKTADYLVQQQAIPAVPSDETLAAGVDGQYLPTGQ